MTDSLKILDQHNLLDVTPPKDPAHAAETLFLCIWAALSVLAGVLWSSPFVLIFAAMVNIAHMFVIASYDTDLVSWRYRCWSLVLCALAAVLTLIGTVGYSPYLLGLAIVANSALGVLITRRMVRVLFQQEQEQ